MTSVALWGKDARDRVLPVLVLGIGLAIMSVFALMLYETMQGTLDDLTASFPAGLDALVGGGDEPGGYVVGELFNLIAPIAIVGYAVMLGASVSAGEEDDGTISVLMSTPISRMRYILTKAVTVLVAVAVSTALFWVGVSIAASVTGLDLDQTGVAAACLQLALLALFFGYLALAVGALKGRGAIAAGVAGGVAVLSYLVATFVPLTEFPDWAKISPWYYYMGSNPLANGFDVAHIAVLAGLALAAGVLAVVSYPRRDLNS